MTLRLEFDPHDAPLAQLLAATLAVREALRRHARVHLRVPRQVHDALPASSYAQVLADTLNADHADLAERLTLRVWSEPAFEIRPSDGGIPGEIDESA